MKIVINGGKYAKNLVSALVCLSLASCQTINSTFEGLSKLPNPLSYISESTKTSAETAVNQAIPPKKIKAQYESAKPYIIQMISTSACVTNETYTRLNKFVAPPKTQWHNGYYSGFPMGPKKFPFILEGM